MTAAAQRAGLRPATVSRLCTGKTDLARAEFKSVLVLARLAGCAIDDLLLPTEKVEEEHLDAFIDRWAASGAGTYEVGGPRSDQPFDVETAVAAVKALPRVRVDAPSPPLLKPIY